MTACLHVLREHALVPRDSQYAQVDWFESNFEEFLSSSTHGNKYLCFRALYVSKSPTRIVLRC